MKSELIAAEISTSVDLDKWLVKIKNKTEKNWEDILVMLQDCYSQDICVWFGTVYSGREVSIPIVNNMHFYHFENGLKLRIYKNNQSVYERVFNHHRKRAFIFYSNKAFEELTKKAIEGLRNYSELEIIYYTIGFDSNIELPEVYCIRHDPSKNFQSTEDYTLMQMIKPEMLLRAIDDGVEDGLFIDSDVQVRGSIESVFERYSHVNPSSPVLNRNHWQFLYVFNQYVPHKELSNKMGYFSEKQFQGHGITNIFLFRKEMAELFNEWKYWCQEPEIVNDFRHRFYLHDEVIFNLLCWKNKIKQIQGNLLFNVQGLKDVKAFMHLQAKPGETHLNFNDFGCGHFSQSFCPYDKSDVVGFHCVKDPNVAHQINDYLKRLTIDNIL